jgi:hypothetical protein
VITQFQQNIENTRRKLFEQHLKFLINKGCSLKSFIQYINGHLRMYCYCSNRPFYFNFDNTVAYIRELGDEFKPWLDTQLQAIEIEHLIKNQPTYTNKIKRT